jgi:hypothetical protein
VDKFNLLVKERRRRLNPVERSHPMTSLRGGEREKADVRSEVQRRRRAVSKPSQTEGPFDPAVALKACAAIAGRQLAGCLKSESARKAEQMCAAGSQPPSGDPRFCQGPRE